MNGYVNYAMHVRKRPHSNFSLQTDECVISSSNESDFQIVGNHQVGSERTSCSQRAHSVTTAVLLLLLLLCCGTVVVHLSLDLTEKREMVVVFLDTLTDPTTKV